MYVYYLKKFIDYDLISGFSRNTQPGKNAIIVNVLDGRWSKRYYNLMSFIEYCLRTLQVVNQN